MQRLVKTASVLVTIVLVAAPAAGAATHRVSPPRRACRVPSLDGLTAAQARVRAKRAHCRLRLEGAALVKATVQTVARQSPAPSRRSAAVTVWLNPLIVARNPVLCIVPNLTGLTVAEAEASAAHAGCTLKIEGAHLKRAEVQTVERQSPEPSVLSAGVTVWANPFCAGSAASGPLIGEPLVTPGPTELVSGFFIAGGPLDLFSTPECKRTEPSPAAGTVEVMDASGALVATGTSAPGQFVEIPLPAGSYTIRGTFLQAIINGVNPKETESVEITQGDTVRQDFVLGVP